MDRFVGNAVVIGNGGNGGNAGKAGGTAGAAAPVGWYSAGMGSTA